MAFHWGKRILRFIILLLGVSILCFILTALSSIDPVTYIIRRGNLSPTPEVIEQVREELGLDSPLPIRYFTWIAGALHGDFGESVFTRNPVSEDLAAYFPTTLRLLLLTLAEIIVFSLLLGVLCAAKQNKLIDHIMRGISISPNAFNEDLTPKDELMNQTMGTGPYLYEGDGDGTFYTFVRNPNYWDEAPDVDSFTVKVISDPESAVLALRNGEVDLLAGTSRLSFAGYTELSSADGIGTTLDDSVSNSRFIGFNTQKAPFNDAAVRQAVAYAIDKETISTNVFSGLESVSTYLLDPTLPYCDVETTTYSYDPDKAMELLESAGWVDSDGDGVREKDGVTLSVTLDYITNQGTLDDAALVIAQELGEVGFDVTLRGADNMTWFTQVFTDFDFSLHSTYGGYYDPFLTMSNMNPEMMSDPILWQVALAMENGTALIQELDSTADLDRVQEIYDEVLSFTADQAVLVPLTSAHQYAAFNSDKISGFSFGSDQLLIEIANVQGN